MSSNVSSKYKYSLTLLKRQGVEQGLNKVFLETSFTEESY